MSTVLVKLHSVFYCSLMLRMKDC